MSRLGARDFPSNAVRRSASVWANAGPALAHTANTATTNDVLNRRELTATSLSNRNLQPAQQADDDPEHVEGAAPQQAHAMLRARPFEQRRHQSPAAPGSARHDVRHL